MGLISLIANKNYIIVNKILAQTFGVDSALMLGELASEFEYWEKEGKVTDGFFFSTIENVQENTTLSDKKQRAALNALRDAGIVEVKLKGLPAKRYIKINEEQLLPYLLNSSGGNGETRSAEMEDLETPKEQGNNNNSNSNKNSNNQKKDKKKRSAADILSEIEDETLKQAFCDYIDMRKMIKSPLTERALQMLIKRVQDLEPLSVDRQVKLLETAILNNWKSVYPLQERRQNPPRQNPQTQKKTGGDGLKLGDAFMEQLMGMYNEETEN